MIFNSKIKWAFRKIKLPVKKNGLVLDIGSGGRPYPRSDILFDRLSGSDHRCGDSLMVDRPIVFGDAAKKLPFQDKVFDFVVASHILEHIKKPDIFLNELQRVSKAGYIETPNAIFERFFPYEIHCLEIIEKDGILLIQNKSQPVQESFLGEAGIFREGSPWKNYLFNEPQLFHVRYFWKDKITYKILNPEVSVDWIESINENSSDGEIKNDYSEKHDSTWRGIGLTVLNKWYQHNRKKRLKNFNIVSILQCIHCNGSISRTSDSELKCIKCGSIFECKDGIPNFI